MSNHAPPELAPLVPVPSLLDPTGSSAASASSAGGRRRPDSRAEADLASARRVLEVETEALAALARSLDLRLSEALDLLQRPGRVVVTGMGKSGHVARKIAATLASTGTPALFVHPAEASHGDLGMITDADAVLALSNSGETAELADVIAYTRRFAIPLVAITGRSGSTLARSADCALILPASPEACPLGLAPTTSTTLMLALGDALAVALLERRGFTPERYRDFHPGGRLGARLARVEALMHRAPELPLAPKTLSMAEAIVRITEKRFGCLGVVDAEGKLCGIITDGDLRRLIEREREAPDLLRREAASVMTPNPRTTSPDLLAAEALRRMNEAKVTALFVVEDERPIGILHIHDLLRAGVA